MRRSTLMIALLLLTAAAPAQFRFFRGGEAQRQHAPVQQPYYAPQEQQPQVQPTPTPQPTRSSRAQTAPATRRSEPAKPATNTRSRSESNDSKSNKSTTRKETSKSFSSKIDSKSAAKELELTKEEKEMIAAQKELLKAADQATTVVADFLKYAQNGSYSKAAELLTAETQSYFKSDLSAIYGNLKIVLDQITQGGDIRAVTYSSVSVRGEGAHVDAEISYRSGAVQRRAFDLIKVQNNWRISMPIGPQALALVQRPAEPPVAAAAAVQPMPAAPEEKITQLNATDSATTNGAESAQPNASQSEAVGAVNVEQPAAAEAPAVASTGSTFGSRAAPVPAVDGNLPRSVSVPAAPVEQPTENLPISVSTGSPVPGDSATTPTALSDAPWGSR